MKRYLLCLLLVMLVRSGFAEGMVDFRNGSVVFATTANRKIYLPGGIPLVGTNYVAALYYLPGADRGAEIFSGGNLAFGLNGLAYAHFRPETTSQPGVWLNSPQVGNMRYLVGVSLGQTVTLQVRVWDITRHPDWPRAVINGEYQMTAPFNYLVPPPTASPQTFYMENMRSSVVLQPPSVPLTVSKVGDSAILSWPALTYVPFMELEVTADLGGAWTLVPPPYFTNLDRVLVTNSATADRRFYRLKSRTP